MRIFMPLSDEISMESTLDPSSISTSFLTYRRSIISPQFDQFPRKFRDNVRPVRCQQYIVLNPNPAPTRPVDPRLNCDDRTHRQWSIGGLGEAGGFVHLQADPMAQRMAERLAPTAALNVAP